MIYGLIDGLIPARSVWARAENHCPLGELDLALPPLQLQRLVWYVLCHEARLDRSFPSMQVSIVLYTNIVYPVIARILPVQFP